MVRILIRLRAASIGNARQSRFAAGSLIAAGVFGLLVAGSTLLLGFTVTGSIAGSADQLALVVLTWAVGRVGFVAFSGGDPAITLDLFRIVPVPRRTLARSLLVVGFADPALFFMAIAFAGVAVFGFRHGPEAGMVGVVGVAGTLILLSFLSTVVGALVPSGSRRRQDLGTMLAAVLISAVVVAGTLIQSLLALLGAEQVPLLSVILRILPTGWASDAVALTAVGDLPLALLVLVGLGAGCWLLASWWPHVLDARLVAGGGTGGRARGGHRRRLLPATPLGSVTSREVRLWIRDPTRAGFLLIAFIVGIGVCLVPLLTQGTALLLPFAGLGTVLIAAAVAGNLYGFDGAAFGIVLSAPNTARADVGGRQLGWLLLVGPYSVLLSVAGVLVGGQAWAWPWVLGLLPAVLGGAVGVLPFLSVVAVQPLDDNGSPGAAWVVKAYATLLLTAVTAIPALALLIVGGASGLAWIGWAAVPVGVVTGVALAVALGRVARGRLAARGPEIFAVLSAAAGGR
ncbi:hypothetical protein [Leifsonia sp. NPDC058230]|uniref:hypothetical protein n=1 Tax=Leifsonia sp. NPDC058230 TaxID=3346391 RepID=UPI0036D999BB